MKARGTLLGVHRCTQCVEGDGRVSITVRQRLEVQPHVRVHGLHVLGHLVGVLPWGGGLEDGGQQHDRHNALREAEPVLGGVVHVTVNYEAHVNVDALGKGSKEVLQGVTGVAKDVPRLHAELALRALRETKVDGGAVPVGVGGDVNEVTRRQLLLPALVHRVAARREAPRFEVEVEDLLACPEGHITVERVHLLGHPQWPVIRLNDSGRPVRGTPVEGHKHLRLGVVILGGASDARRSPEGARLKSRRILRIRRYIAHGAIIANIPWLLHHQLAYIKIERQV